MNVITFMKFSFSINDTNINNIANKTFKKIIYIASVPYVHISIDTIKHANEYR